MSFLRILMVCATAFAAATLIDPYIGPRSSIYVQMVNALPAVLAGLLLLSLTGRVLVTVALQTALLGSLRYANMLKESFLDANIVYADFTIIPTLLQDVNLVLGFVAPSAGIVFIAAFGLTAFAFAIWLFLRENPVGWKPRSFCLAVTAAALLGAGSFKPPVSTSLLGQYLNWSPFEQSSGARLVGIAGNIVLGGITAKAVKRPADHGAATAFWDEPLVRQAMAALPKEAASLRPDIVVIQSESLFEPTQLCKMSDAPVLETLAAQNPTRPDNLEVPVYGGQTLQSEFEMITGAPVSFYNGSMFAYYELLSGPVNAFPRILGDNGYKTIAIHPNQRGFWNRTWALPAMGFETFLDIHSFLNPQDFSHRRRVSDLALMRSVLAELDAADRPTFVMAITMDNHGPWGEFAPDDDKALGLPKSLKGAARRQLADYIARSRDADEAHGFLVDALMRRKRPTVVVLYGDHLPAMPKVYKNLCFKNGKAPGQQNPLYRVWTNFPAPPAPQITSAYLLQGWIARAAGLPLEGQLLANAVAGALAHDPAIPEADRKRILNGYAHVAAAHLETEVHARAETGSGIFIGYEKALTTLLSLKAEESPAGRFAVENGDLRMELRPNGSSTGSFKPEGGVMWMTLRPYLAPVCADPAKAQRARFTVKGDGRILYSASLSGSAFRLATLDLRGIGTVSFHAEADACSSVSVRLAQMQCFSSTCRGSDEEPLAAAPKTVSRILDQDESENDIAALPASMKAVMHRNIEKKAALKLMMDRIVEKRTGHSEFTIHQDGQLLMHPGSERSAWIDFDVRNLERVFLSPMIDQLSPACLALNEPGREGGVVGLSLFLDGKPVRPRMIVDRTDKDTLAIAIGSSRTLRIEVDKGNDVESCDWFSIGFPKLEIREGS